MVLPSVAHPSSVPTLAPSLLLQNGTRIIDEADPIKASITPTAAIILILVILPVTMALMYWRIKKERGSCFKDGHFLCPPKHAVPNHTDDVKRTRPGDVAQVEGGSMNKGAKTGQHDSIPRPHNSGGGSLSQSVKSGKSGKSGKTDSSVATTRETRSTSSDFVNSDTVAYVHHAGVHDHQTGRSSHNDVPRRLPQQASQSSIELSNTMQPPV